ncbi:MAG: DUF6020 family protein [Lachnospiraceae bacterium]|nr:DUF6020 family protein [Lachnospiraceae bacterium]
MKRVLNSLKNWIDTDRSDFIRTFLLSEGFGFCLCISFIWGFRLDVYGGVSGWLIKSILLSLFFGDIVADLLMFALLYARERGARRKGAAGELAEGRAVRAAVDLRVWAAASCVIIACWIPIWLAYYPAVFAYDVETQLGQVISGPYSTHHPLLHTLIMGGCMKLMWNAGGINAGMALYAVLQMLFMGITGGWALAEARRLGTSRPVLILYGAFLALFPVNGILAVSTTKDVIFSGLMLIELLLVRRILKGETCFGRGLWVKTAIATAALIIFRNNALYALVPAIVIYMFIRPTDEPDGKTGTGGKSRKRAFVLTLAAGCLAGCLVNGGLKAALHAESGSPREALSIPIQQMARAYSLHRDELPEDLRSDLEMCLGGDVTDVYDPHLADKVKKQVYLKDIRCFIKSWFEIITKYPGDSFDAWLYTTEGAWYIGDTSANRIYGTGGGFGYLNTDTRSMPYGFEVTHRPVLPVLTEALEKAFSDNAFETVPVLRRIFSPALYVWILATFLYVCLVRRDRAGVASLLIPGFVYLTILCGPAVLVRYMYPYMLMVIYPFIPNKETSKDTIPSVDSPETDER